MEPIHMAVLLVVGFLAGSAATLLFLALRMPRSLKRKHWSKKALIQSAKVYRWGVSARQEAPRTETK